MKTIKQASKEANPDFKGEKKQAFNKGFEAGVKYALKWTKSDEDIPMWGGIILVKNKEWEINLIYGRFLNKDIHTHWRYIDVTNPLGK